MSLDSESDSLQSLRTLYSMLIFEIGQPTLSPRRKKEEIDENIKRLTYEYVEKEAKRRAAEYVLYRIY